MKNNTRKLSVILVLIAVLLMSLTSCGKASRDDEIYSSMDNASGSMGSAPENSASGGSSNITQDKAEHTSDPIARKIIYNAALTLETKAFDEDTEKLTNLAAGLGGYIESSSQNGRTYADNTTRRSAKFVFRIPQEKFDEFKDGVKEICNILHSSTSTKDITESYYDTEARLEALRTQETKLLSMYEKAKTLDEMLLIEDKLTDVRYRIESLERTLMSYDSAVSYSTFDVTVNEVKEYTEPAEKSWGGRLAEAFVDGFSFFGTAIKELTVFFVYLLPWMILPAIVLAAALVISKKKKKKTKNDDKVSF